MISRIKAWLASRLMNGRDKAEKLWTMLFERSPLPQAIISSDGVYLDVNAAYCALHAVTRADLLGKSPVTAGFTTPGELAALLEVFHQNEDHPEGHVLKYSTGHGVLYARVFAHSITIDDYSGILMVLHDISKQQLAEEALKESERLLHTVLDSIPTRVFWKDKNSTFMGCNHWAAHDAGFASAADVIGKSDYDLWPKDAADKFIQDDRDVMNANATKLFFEEQLPNSNGAAQWRLTSKVPLKDADGTVIGLLGTYDDITARKRAETDLKLARFSINHRYKFNRVGVEKRKPG